MLKCLLVLSFSLAFISLALAQECKDISRWCKPYIKLWKRYHLSKTQTCAFPFARDFCNKTCGICEGLIECNDTPYGCCWDEVTPRGPNGECPMCRNVYLRFCPRFRHICDRRRVPGIYGLGARFRRICPVTCKMCEQGTTIFKRKFRAGRKDRRSGKARKH
ncbi:uncharacterized protein LOC116619008 isoform X1 [Nematostella vectensis]|uniref:uncharacterized protein LOC116619008 isoform X1 n=1 Tax=Nematostella vectensis TaxID=45351 RepID=UPI00138FE30D|nr:uncharacterized protein LOC116619008 isoform X1 [Nematostella vectensis]